MTTTRSEHAMPTQVRARLWREAEDGHAYAILDAAQFEGLLDRLYGPEAPVFECLLPGELEADMAAVAPYLVRLEQGSAFTQWLLQNGWGLNRGVWLTSALPLSALWRRLRSLVQVYGSAGEPLYFRFYDPRVLRMFLPGCDAAALQEMLQGVRFYISEGEGAHPANAWSLQDGRLVVEEL
jgi:hypothetical protein